MQIHVDDGRYDHHRFRPWRVQSLAFKALRRLQPDYALWRDFAYEYEHERRAIDPVSYTHLDVYKRQPVPSPAQDKAQQELTKGIISYENSAYERSANQIQNALTLGLEARKDEAKAHKYLAFMHCVGGRERLCRDEFRKAIGVDPTFNLTCLLYTSRCV